MRVTLVAALAIFLSGSPAIASPLSPYSGGGPPAGAVSFGGTSTDNAIARWDGTTGLVLQNSVIGIDDTTGATGPFAATGANVAGTAYTVHGGQSTGSAAGGSIIFQVSPAGGAGSGVNALATRMQILSSGTIDATTNASFRMLTASDAVGGCVNTGNVAGRINLDANCQNASGRLVLDSSDPGNITAGVVIAPNAFHPSGTLSAATGNETFMSVTPTVNKLTSGNYTGILLNVTETSAPGTDDRLLDLQVGGATKFYVANSGLAESADMIRAKGNGTSGVSGAGAEMQVNSGRAVFGAYNRTTSAYIGGNLDALDWRFQASNVTVATLDSTGIAMTGTSGNITVSRKILSTPQAVACSDNGAGSAQTCTLNVISNAVQTTCNDADGCTWTVGETGATNGHEVTIVEMGSTGASNYSDTAGVTELSAAFAAGQYDSLKLIYASDRWVEVGRSNN